MANIRHVVVIRRDLNLTAGLMSAQTAHASDAFMRDKIRDDKEFTYDEKAWMLHPYISVLGVDNLEELELVEELAKGDGLQVYEWRDLIPSKNLKRDMANVKVAISIGPDDMDKIKKITGGLPLA
jgi:peptidyl-tRNA hydrolase